MLVTANLVENGRTFASIPGVLLVKIKGSFRWYHAAIASTYYYTLDHESIVGLCEVNYTVTVLIFHFSLVR